MSGEKARSGKRMDIKPIETVYNGYRFRSRLEARWAVFFDAMGLAYEYEREGFDLHGEWYLPDFWLRDLVAWVEIKPWLDEALMTDDQWHDKLRQDYLCHMLSVLDNYDVCLIRGNPYHKEHECWLFRRGKLVGVGDMQTILIPDSAVHEGYRVARQARFEHKEVTP